MFQPIEEKNAERELIQFFASKFNFKIIKVQNDIDDGEMDGILKIGNKEMAIEARRKGYPNHKGRKCVFHNGWESKCLVNGIFLNELTIRKHKNKGFVYLVDIQGDVRYCFVSYLKIESLLKQPYKEMKSTNSGVMQSVKNIPLNWFAKI